MISFGDKIRPFLENIQCLASFRFLFFNLLKKSLEGGIPMQRVNRSGHSSYCQAKEKSRTKRASIM